MKQNNTFLSCLYIDSFTYRRGDPPPKIDFENVKRFLLAHADDLEKYALFLTPEKQIEEMKDDQDVVQIFYLRMRGKS